MGDVVEFPGKKPKVERPSSAKPEMFSQRQGKVLLLWALGMAAVVTCIGTVVHGARRLISKARGTKTKKTESDTRAT